MMFYDSTALARLFKELSPGGPFGSQLTVAKLDLKTSVLLECLVEMSAKSEGNGKASCKSCLQVFGGKDSFSPGGDAPLRWAKMRLNPATGVRDLPDGGECYGCEALGIAVIKSYAATT